MMQEENIFAGIRLADDCFCDQPNIQQFVQTWQKTSSEGFDYGCLKGLQKYIQNNKINCLSALNMFPRLPLYRFDEETLKMTYAILDDVVDKKPNLKHKVLDLVELLYQSPNNSHFSTTRVESMLFRMARKYPETIERIEKFTSKKIAQLEPHSDILPDLEYVFMGREKPCTDKFEQPETDGHGLKFAGGLWTSPKTANGHSEWYNWAKYEEFYENIDEQNIYYIEPTKDSRCLVVESLQDLEPYILNATIDVNTLKKDYDCIYVEDPRDDKFNNDELNLYLEGWDVSTLVMLKADKFKAFTAEEWERHKQVSQKIKHNDNTNSSSSAKNNKNISDYTSYIKGLISLQELRKRRLSRIT